MSSTHVFMPAQLAQYGLSLRVGELHAPQGQTELILNGNGHFHASQRYAGQPGDKEGLSARGEIGREQLESLLRTTLQFDWSAKFPPRLGIPGEAVVSWALSGPQLPEQTLRMWLRDAERNPLSMAVLGALREALAKASDERLFL